MSFPTMWEWSVTKWRPCKDHVWICRDHVGTICDHVWLCRLYVTICDIPCVIMSEPCLTMHEPLCELSSVTNCWLVGWLVIISFLQVETSAAMSVKWFMSLVGASACEKAMICSVSGSSGRFSCPPGSAMQMLADGVRQSLRRTASRAFKSCSGRFR